MYYDAHIHMALDGLDWKAARAAHLEKPDDSLIRARLQSYADTGIDWLRDGGDCWGVSLRAAELAPEYGITYRTPGFALFPKGRYGGFLGRGFADGAEYLRLLEEVRQSGGHYIKLMLSGLMDFRRYGVLTEPDLDPESIQWLIREAHRAGFAVMAHCNGDLAIRAALEAGVDSLEHGAYMSRETAQYLAASDTVWVPTLSPVAELIGRRDPDSDVVLTQLMAEQRSLIRMVVCSGGNVACGSDAGAQGVLHAAGTVREWQMLDETIEEKQHLTQSGQMLREKF